MNIPEVGKLQSKILLIANILSLNVNSSAI